VLASEPHTVASGPFQLSFHPWLKPQLTSLPPIVGDWCGRLSRIFRKGRSA